MLWSRRSRSPTKMRKWRRRLSGSASHDSVPLIGPGGGSHHLRARELIPNRARARNRASHFRAPGLAGRFLDEFRVLVADMAPVAASEHAGRAGGLPPAELAGAPVDT